MSASIVQPLLVLKNIHKNKHMITIEANNGERIKGYMARQRLKELVAALKLHA